MSLSRQSWCSSTATGKIPVEPVRKIQGPSRAKVPVSPSKPKVGFRSEAGGRKGGERKKRKPWVSTTPELAHSAFPSVLRRDQSSPGVFFQRALSSTSDTYRLFLETCRRSSLARWLNVESPLCYFITLCAIQYHPANANITNMEHPLLVVGPSSFNWKFLGCPWSFRRCRDIWRQKRREEYTE